MRDGRWQCRAACNRVACRPRRAPVRTFPVDRAGRRALRGTPTLSRFQTPGAKRGHTRTYWNTVVRTGRSCPAPDRPKPAGTVSAATTPVGIPHESHIVGDSGRWPASHGSTAESSVSLLRAQERWHYLPVLGILRHPGRAAIWRCPDHPGGELLTPVRATGTRQDLIASRLLEPTNAESPQNRGQNRLVSWTIRLANEMERIEGTAETLAPFTSTTGALLVDDVQPYYDKLVAAGAKIISFASRSHRRGIQCRSPGWNGCRIRPSSARPTGPVISGER